MAGTRLQAIFSLIDRVTGPVQRISRAMGGLRRTLNGVALGLGAAGTAAFTAGLAFMGKGIWEVSKQFENYTAVLKVTLGSQEKANAAMSWVEDFANRTPYDLGEVTEAYIKLTSYGIDPQTRAMKSLGDVAAGMNKKYNEAVEAMADATTGEFERLKEFGIRSQQAGNDVIFAYDYAGKQVTKKVKKSSTEIQAALMDIFDTKFGGAMEALSKTGKGLEDNLKGWLTSVQRLIGDMGFYDHVKKRLGGVTGSLEKLKKNGQLTAWAKQMSDAMIKLFDAVDKFVSSIDWVGLVTFLTNVTTGLTGFITAMGGFGNIVDIGIAAWIFSLVSGLSALIPVLISVTAALAGPAAAAAVAAAPIAGIIALVALLAAGAYLVYRNWDKIVAWFGGIWDQVVAAWSGAPAQISGFFSGLWDGVKAVFSGFIDWVSDNFMSFPLPLKILALPALIIKHWDTVKGWFTEAWAWIQKTWSGLPWWMQALINLPATIVTHWDTIKGWFAASWTWIQKVWSGLPWWVQALLNLPAAIMTNWGAIKDGMADLWANIAGVWSTVSDFFGGIWDDIKAAFKSGTDQLWNSLPEWLQKILKGIAFAVRFVTGGPDLAGEKPSGQLNGGSDRPMASPRPMANVGARQLQAQPQTVGGEIGVHVTSDGQARVTSLKAQANTKLRARTDLGMQRGGR